MMASFLIAFIPTVKAETSYPTHLMNGNFETPVVPKISSSDGDLSSGSQGAWYLNTTEGYEAMSDNNFFWQTTSSDGKMEIVSVNRGSLNGYGVKAPYDGDQFAELIAEEQSSLYQNISTPYPGTVQNWSLSHAGRTTKDTMALFIGPKQDSYSKTKGIQGDIFMWMAELIRSSSDINWSTAEVGATAHTVYSQANIDITQITKDNYTDYFSLSKTALINQEWKCWLITDNAGEWGSYSGSYTVPEDQPITTFAFTALTGYANSPQIAGQYNEGNLLDGFSFATTFPLRVATTEGGYVTLNVTDETVTYDNDHISNYDDGTEIVVTATPYDGYHLLGAYINGTFCSLSDDGHFTKTDDDSYSHNVVIDQARYVQLIFAKSETLIYDANGGMYKGSIEDTEITMASNPEAESDSYNVWENTEDAVPLPENEGKQNFIGWYVARVTHNGVSGGALIDSNHTVSYQVGTPGDISDDTLKLDYNLVVRGGSGSQEFDLTDGLVFIAQWEYLQEAISMTKHSEDAEYHEDVHGGTVSQIIEDSDSTIVRENNFGRLRDIVTLTAHPSNGYRFRGWYDENGTLLSEGITYEYEVSQATKIYAHFSEAHTPIISFVSATGSEKLNGMGTHTIRVIDGATPDSALTGIGGLKVYGNTISTGFLTRQILDADHAYRYSQWSITIPTPTQSTPLYIKKDAISESLDFVFNSTPVIEDDAEVQVNKGNIYEVLNLVNGEDYLVINIFNTLPTVVTGGFVEITYNITIDNIYAPGATATLDLKESAADMLFGSVDITEDGDKYIHSGSMDEYLTDPDNEYSSADETKGVQ